MRESSEEGRVANQLKLKTPINDSEGDKFEFDHCLPELDEFSFSSGQPFLDFDAFKDWIEEMDPEREEAIKIEIGGGLQVECCLENSVDKCSVDIVQDMKDPENSAPVKATLGNVGPAEICCEGDIGELKTPCGDDPCSGVLNDRNCPKFESLGRSIEEELEKVSLGATVSSVTAIDTKDTKVAHVNGEVDNDSSSESESESESESGTSSSSSSSATSSSESDDDEEDEEENEKGESCKIMTENTKQRVEVEEGEIMGSDVEKMVSWSGNGDDDDNDNDDDEDDEPGEDFVLGDVEDSEDVTIGPIKSKNELADLPLVPPVNVTLQPCHQILPVGVVSSILGPQVVVEGSEKHNPLSEGSILWMTEKRLPLGTVDEIFGPVKTPYYIVRYNSENEVPAGIQTGTLVGFVPEFVDHVLNDKNLFQKGYDASGENDEEVLDEFEFSDDEKEAEYKRMMKMSRRGNNNNNNQGPGNKRKNRRNPKSQDKTWTKDQRSAPQAQSGQTSQFNQRQQQVSTPPRSSFSQGNQSGFSSNAPILPAASGGPTPFPQQAQAQVPAGFLFNGLWANGMPIQQQNMGFPAAFQIPGMPWLQPQNPPNPNSLQMPAMIPTPWQQQQPFDLSQLVSGSNASPMTPMNFANGPGNLPWPGMLGPNLSSNQAPLIFPGLSTQFPIFRGMQPNGPQAGQDCNSQSAASFPGNVGAHPQFNQGFSNAGRGRKPFHQRGGGGRFGGGRGRQQSK